MSASGGRTPADITAAIYRVKISSYPDISERLRMLANARGSWMWWARQDSNLQPDRYERPALTIELQAPPAPPLTRQATVPTPLTAWPAIRQCRVSGPATRPKPRRIRPPCAIFRSHRRPACRIRPASSALEFRRFRSAASAPDGSDSRPRLPMRCWPQGLPDNQIEQGCAQEGDHDLSRVAFMFSQGPGERLDRRRNHFLISGHAASGGPNASSPGIFARIV